MKFSDLPLHPQLGSAVCAMGFVDLTPIQERAIPVILAGTDVIGLAETGSGKTSACAIPLVQRVDVTAKTIQALVLVPTRELALQYVQEVDALARHTPVSPFAVYGGFDLDIQKAKLSHGVHILVATPGRLIDLIWNQRLDLSHVRTVVVDEADELLKMGFIEDVDFIMDCMVHEHQTLLFSATMPPQIEKLTGKYLRDPVKIELNRDRLAPQSLAHTFRHVAHGNRFQALLDYIDAGGVQQAILFCNSRDGVAGLHRQLQGRVESLEMIHGGLEQDRRSSIFRRFREEKVRLMVATDVAGRGLDFSHVTHVINFDFPRSAEIYTHRTGRAGRMGRVGTAVTFVGDRDLADLRTMLHANRIAPVWLGQEPSLDSAPGPARRQGGRRRDRPQPSSRHRRRRVAGEQILAG